MEPDSVPADPDSLQGGPGLLDPLVDRILGDSVSQQQGWLRVYGKQNSPRGRGGRYRDTVRSRRVRTRSSWTSWRFDPETGSLKIDPVGPEPSQDPVSEAQLLRTRPEGCSARTEPRWRSRTCWVFPVKLKEFSGQNQCSGSVGAVWVRLRTGSGVDLQARSSRTFLLGPEALVTQNLLG